MTKEQAKKILECAVFLQAYVNGSTIQYFDKEDNNWKDCVCGPDPHLSLNSDYRIKPESQYRAWKIEEVPVGAIVKHTITGWQRWVITARCNEGVFLNGAGDGYTGTELDELFNNYQYSLDFGKTWQPCGILV